MIIWKSSIPHISTDGLLALVKDAEARIGSNVAGGFPNAEYVQRQQYLLSLIQKELEDRSGGGDRIENQSRGLVSP